MEWYQLDWKVISDHDYNPRKIKKKKKTQEIDMVKGSIQLEIYCQILNSTEVLAVTTP